MLWGRSYVRETHVYGSVIVVSLQADVTSLIHMPGEGYPPATVALPGRLASERVKEEALRYFGVELDIAMVQTAARNAEAIPRGALSAYTYAVRGHGRDRIGVL